MPLGQVKVAMLASIMKNKSANCMISSWQALEQRPDVVVNGFQKGGILEAVNAVIQD